WLQRIDEGRIASELLHRVSHRSKIDHRRHAGKVLQKYAARGKGNLLFGPTLTAPRGQCLNITFVDVASVFGAKQVFEQDAQRVGKMAGADTGFIKRIQTIDFVVFGANMESGSSAKAVHCVETFLPGIDDGHQARAPESKTALD